MTTVSTRNHARTNWRSDDPPSCLGGSSHWWVPVNTHNTPVPGTPGRLWVAQQHYPYQQFNYMVTERQCCLLSSKSEQPACATVSVPVVTRRVKTRPCLKHTAKPMRFLPSINAEMLKIAVCTHADRAERASMVLVRTVVIVILDSRRPTSAEMRYVKTLTIAVLARVFEQWRRYASENPMRAVDVEELVFERLGL